MTFRIWILFFHPRLPLRVSEEGCLSCEFDGARIIRSGEVAEYSSALATAFDPGFTGNETGLV